MATKNSIDSNIPIEITKGGTNATSFNSNGITYYDGSKINSLDPTSTTGYILTSNGAGSAPSLSYFISDIGVNLQTGFVYTLVITDAEGIVIMNKSLSNTLVIPPNSSVAFDIGTEIYIMQQDAGVTSIVAGQGVTINANPDLLSITKKYALISLIKIDTNTWNVSGLISNITINLTAVTSGYLGAAGNGIDVNFSPNESFISVGSNTASNQLSVWSWNGSSTIANVETLNIGSDVPAAKWHSNGNYLAAIISNATNSVTIYSWNGTDTLTPVETVNITNGASYCDWHPNGNYLAVTNYNTSAAIKVYSWNGTDTLTEVETINISQAAYYCRWSNDGNFLYVGSAYANKGISIWSWNGTDTLTEAASYNLADLTAHYGRRAVWYSDDSYIFIGRSELTAGIYVFAWNGSNTLTFKQAINAGYWGLGIDLFADKYLIAGLGSAGSATDSFLRLYTFNKDDEELTEKDTLSYTANGINSLVFSKSGKYLAIGMFTETNITLRIVKLY